MSGAQSSTSPSDHVSEIPEARLLEETVPEDPDTFETPCDEGAELNDTGQGPVAVFPLLQYCSQTTAAYTQKPLTTPDLDRIMQERRPDLWRHIPVLEAWCELSASPSRRERADRVRNWMVGCKRPREALSGV